MIKKLWFLAWLGIFILSIACGKKAPPIPRDQVLKKETQKSASQSEEKVSPPTSASENKDTQ